MEGAPDVAPEGEGGEGGGTVNGVQQTQWKPSSLVFFQSCRKLAKIPLASSFSISHLTFDTALTSFDMVFLILCFATRKPAGRNRMQ